MNSSKEGDFYLRLKKYFPRFYRFNLREESYGNLQRLIGEVEASIRVKGAETIKVKERREKIRAIDSRIAGLQSQIDVLVRQQLEARGLLAMIFNTEPSQKGKELQEAVVLLEREKSPLVDERWRLSVENKGHWYCERDIELLEWYLRKIEPILRRKKDTEDAWIELRNRAAVNSQQIRMVADVVKDRLRQNKSCPYCDGDLGTAPHADHIYPVSKGGRSTPKNMVYVCASCNEKKSDLTLSAFIRHYGLDREVIEQRLHSLGKEY